MHFGSGAFYTVIGERSEWAKAHFFVSAVWGGCYGSWSRSEAEACAPAMPVDLDKIRAIAERVVTSEGLTLVDVELKGGRASWLLRICIDKPEGVSHADCQLVSEQLSAILDVEDLFPASYVLEVSSPGLDRKLVKPSDFAHFAGRRARLVLREAVGQEKVFEGRLAGFEDGRVRLDLGERGVAEFELSNISKAKLVAKV